MSNASMIDIDKLREWASTVTADELARAMHELPPAGSLLFFRDMTLDEARVEFPAKAANP